MLSDSWGGHGPDQTGVYFALCCQAFLSNDGIPCLDQPVTLPDQHVAPILNSSSPKCKQIPLSSYQPHIYYSLVNQSMTHHPSRGMKRTEKILFWKDYFNLDHQNCAHFALVITMHQHFLTRFFQFTFPTNKSWILCLAYIIKMSMINLTLYKWFYISLLCIIYSAILCMFAILAVPAVRTGILSLFQLVAHW